MDDVRTMPCPKCSGTGTLIDPRDEGLVMRRRREAAGLSLRAIAGPADLSISYLCDAELGRRPWNARLREAYARAFEAARA